VPLEFLRRKGGGARASKAPVLAPEPDVLPPPPRSLREAVWGPFVGFLAQHRALEILAFVVCFKLADNLAQALTRPFLVDMGYDELDRGVALATVGLAATLGGTFVGLVLAHIVIVLPFALRLTLASAIGLDRSIEHAAVSLGASEWIVLKRITLPLVLPGLASGWALAFINSFDEVTMISPDHFTGVSSPSCVNR